MFIIQLTLIVAQQCSEYQFDIPFFPGVSCEDIYNRNPQSHEMSGYYWILDGPSRVYCGMSYTGLSCEDIYLNNQATREKSGYYRINNNNWMFCDMDATRDALLSRGDLISSCAGVEGVWRRIGNFDIAAGDNCPSPWVEILHNGVNYCTSSLSSIGCFSVSYSTNSVSYQRVCGRATVYSKDTPDNFNRNLGIDSYYVDGISITRGNPRQHIWTYAFGSCRSPPSFVGTHYNCQPTVNSISTLPWFYHQLSDSTQDDVEVRICTDEAFNNEAILINNLELYVE